MGNGKRPPARRQNRRGRPSQNGNRPSQNAQTTRRLPDELPPTELAVAVAEGDPGTGILDILPAGFGFLRTKGYAPSDDDVHVSRGQITRLALRSGDEITGVVRPASEGTYRSLVRVDAVNGGPVEGLADRPTFEELPSPSPIDRLYLEYDPAGHTQRILDILCPIGKGQRGLVVAPPKAGKTTVLKEIANGIIHNHPEAHVIVLLVDERPEEVFDWKTTVKANEIVSSTFDRAVGDHVRMAELVLERAKRMVESGSDVVILLDSLTRLARAYNQAAPSTGRTMSGGIDSGALEGPKRFFGSARNIEGNGSLTIMASVLVETGSRGDDVIFEDFKGRGNMEVRLDRALADRRLFPAINVEGTGTRKEELLLTPEDLEISWKLRRVLHAVDAEQALKILLENMRKTKTNAQFFETIAQVPS